MLKYLFNSTVYFDKPDDQGAIDPEVARKAEIQKQRDSIKVTKVDVEASDDDKSNDDKSGDKDDSKGNDNEQEKEDGEEETQEEGGEEEIEEKDEDKEELKAAKKAERLEKKYNRTADKLKDREKRIRELEAKLAADPDKSKLSEEDIEALAEKKAEEKQRIKELNKSADNLADGAQKKLKLTDKQWNELVKEVIEEVGNTPAIVVELLAELDNGSDVVAHLFKNVDEAEEIYKLKDHHAKLGLELAKLSAKLAAKPQKKISQVPDAPEPLGGKSAGGDRLAILAAKKNLTQSEMAEYVQQRNMQVAQARASGKHNLR